jgi:hypothetical protein
MGVIHSVTSQVARQAADARQQYMLAAICEMKGSKLPDNKTMLLQVSWHAKPPSLTTWFLCMYGIDARA